MLTIRFHSGLNKNTGTNPKRLGPKPAAIATAIGIWFLVLTQIGCLVAVVVEGERIVKAAKSVDDSVLRIFQSIGQPFGSGTVYHELTEIDKTLSDMWEFQQLHSS